MTDEDLEAFVRESAKEDPKDLAKRLIARRAAKELKPGQLVNIGVGAPEFVGVEAARSGMLSKVALTVEAGVIKGLPAGGFAFGAAMGAQSCCTTAEQFDLYDGGGLNICFIGALEIDGEGKVHPVLVEVDGFLRAVSPEAVTSLKKDMRESLERLRKRLEENPI